VLKGFVAALVLSVVLGQIFGTGGIAASIAARGMEQRIRTDPACCGDLRFFSLMLRPPPPLPRILAAALIMAECCG